MKELKIGQNVTSYFFSSERNGKIVGFEKNRTNDILGDLPDLAIIKFDDSEGLEYAEIRNIKFDNKVHSNGIYAKDDSVQLTTNDINKSLNDLRQKLINDMYHRSFYEQTDVEILKILFENEKY